MNNQHPHHPDIERLKKTLLENGESVEASEALAQASLFLRQSPDPKADPRHREQVIEALMAEMQIQQATLRQSWWQRLGEQWWLLVLFTQARVIGSAIWVASLLIMSLGVLVTLPQISAHLSTLPFTMLAPLVTAFGVAFLYDDTLPGIHELEDSTRASLRFLVLARLVLLFSFDLLLALLGSIVLALGHSEISLVPLILTWLAPMTFLAALAFFLSVLVIDPLAASVFSLALWGLYLIARNSEGPFFALLSVPDLTAASARLPLALTTVLLITLALWLVGRPTHVFNQPR